VAIYVSWVVIGQAEMVPAVGVLVGAISFWVAALSRAVGRARLHVKVWVNRGGGQTESAVRTGLGLELSASHDL